nr:hypothetical protein Itr_chr01CG01360 [Ipomoea trifida]GLL24126.1 hypothetical protein Itr_chr04CG05900 [Ipomoea trifida]GLL27479.1 hypothetical protein Itr_chr05CG16090 [Ipomoea trifida]GLL29368.1 hypothetical protein Itr_chr06CG10250 [Ipomoea trifida]GLL41895.1 hypothetical protein Itr_chr12CG14730 [Ipomoea trifida]
MRKLNNLPIKIFKPSKKQYQIININGHYFETNLLQKIIFPRVQKHYLQSFTIHDKITRKIQ